MENKEDSKPLKKAFLLKGVWTAEAPSPLCE